VPVTSCSKFTANPTRTSTKYKLYKELKSLLHSNTLASNYSIFTSTSNTLAHRAGQHTIITNRRFIVAHLYPPQSELPTGNKFVLKRSKN